MLVNEKVVSLIIEKNISFTGSPPSSAPPAELSRYLDRNYWEQRVQPSNLQLEPPSAPTPSPGPTPNTVFEVSAEYVVEK